MQEILFVLRSKLVGLACQFGIVGYAQFPKQRLLNLSYLFQVCAVL